MSELVSPDSQMDSQIISYGKKLLLDDNNILKKRLTFKLGYFHLHGGKGFKKNFKKSRNKRRGREL